MDRMSEAKLDRSIDLGARLPGTCDGTRVVADATVDRDCEPEEELVVVAEEPPAPAVGVLLMDPAVGDVPLPPLVFEVGAAVSVGLPVGFSVVGLPADEPPAVSLSVSV